MPERMREKKKEENACVLKSITDDERTGSVDCTRARMHEMHEMNEVSLPAKMEKIVVIDRHRSTVIPNRVARDVAAGER